MASKDRNAAKQQNVIILELPYLIVIPKWVIFTPFMEKDIEAQRLSNLLKVMPLIKHKTEIQTQASPTLHCLYSPLSSLRLFMEQLFVLLVEGLAYELSTFLVF